MRNMIIIRFFCFLGLYQHVAIPALFPPLISLDKESPIISVFLYLNPLFYQNNREKYSFIGLRYPTSSDTKISFKMLIKPRIFLNEVLYLHLPHLLRYINHDTVSTVKLHPWHAPPIHDFFQVHLDTYLQIPPHLKEYQILQTIFQSSIDDFFSAYFPFFIRFP